MGMVIRQLVKKDLRQYGRLCQYAFSPGGESRDSYKEWVGRFLQHTWGAFDGPTMLAGLWYHPFDMRVGDDFIPMGGVAAVATRPEARDRGLAKKLMRRIHGQMREEERPLAVLMPFKMSFYQRMGYAETFYCHRFRFDPGRLARLDNVRSKLRAVDGPAEWKTLESLQQAYAQRYTGAVRRNRAYWQTRYFNTRQGMRTVYMVERRGQPVGFVIATLTADSIEEDKHRLVINQAVWLDADALSAILRFIRSHRDQVSHVTWYLPTDVDLFPYFDDTAINVALHPKMMLKLVDVKRALGRRSFPPELEGGLILDITADDTSPWNGGRWLIEWTGGKARAHRTRRSAAHLPSLPVTIQQLALMYCGTRTARQMVTGGFLQASPAAIAFLDAAFPPGSPYIEEWF